MKNKSIIKSKEKASSALLSFPVQISPRNYFVILLTLSLCTLLCGCKSQEVTIEYPGSETQNISNPINNNYSTTGDNYISDNIMSTSGVASENDSLDDTPSIIVSITGEVVSPGVYYLNEGARLYELINAAGGVTKDGDISGLNLALKLYDELQITIPSQRKTPENTPDLVPNSTADNALVNINQASLSELMTLPGIGKTRAQAIIDYREKQGSFNSIEDIMKVSGIKEGTYNVLKDCICVK